MSYFIRVFDIIIFTRRCSDPVYIRAKENCCWSVFNDYGLMTNTLVLPYLRVIGTHCYLVRVNVVASGAVSIAAEAGPIFPGARQIVVDVVEGPL